MKPKLLVAFIVGLILIVGIGMRYRPTFDTPSDASISAESSAEKPPEINPDLPPQAGAVLTHADGVTLVRKDVRIVVDEGIELESGDALEVAEDGSAVIIWPHYGRTVVAGGTTLKIQKAFESVNRLRFEVRLALDQGRIWNRFFDVLSQGQYFHIRAGDILVEAPGGSFGVTRDADGEVAIDVRWLAVRAARVVEEAPSGEMRKAGFDKTAVEKPVGDIITISNDARRISTEGTFVPASPSNDAFTESGDAVITPEELDVTPSGATLTADSSL